MKGAHEMKNSPNDEKQSPTRTSAELINRLLSMRDSHEIGDVDNLTLIAQAKITTSITNLAKAQMQYNAQRGEKPDIDFMNAGKL